MSKRYVCIDWDAYEKLADLSGSAVKVLLVLRAHAHNESGLSYPSRETIALAAGITVKTVTNAIKQLESAGLIERVDDYPTASHCYDVNVKDERDTRESDELLAEQPVGVKSTPAPEKTADEQAADEMDSSDERVISTHDGVKITPELLRVQSATHSSAEGHRRALFSRLAAEDGIDLHRINAAERGRLNRATKLITQSGGLPEEVPRFAPVYRDWLSDPAMYTAIGLASNWAKTRSLAEDQAARSSPTLPTADEIMANFR